MPYAHFISFDSNIASVVQHQEFITRIDMICLMPSANFSMNGIFITTSIAALLHCPFCPMPNANADPFAYNLLVHPSCYITIWSAIWEIILSYTEIHYEQSLPLKIVMRGIIDR